jgi:hypothetical protein
MHSGSQGPPSTLTAAQCPVTRDFTLRKVFCTHPPSFGSTEFELKFHFFPRDFRYESELEIFSVRLDATVTSLHNCAHRFLRFCAV